MSSHMWECASSPSAHMTSLKFLSFLLLSSTAMRFLLPIFCVFQLVCGACCCSCCSSRTISYKCWLTMFCKPWILDAMLGKLTSLAYSPSLYSCFLASGVDLCWFFGCFVSPLACPRKRSCTTKKVVHLHQVLRPMRLQSTRAQFICSSALNREDPAPFQHSLSLHYSDPRRAHHWLPSGVLHSKPDLYWGGTACQRYMRVSSHIF